MSDYTLVVSYALLALVASFLCSILEAVLLSTTQGHIRAMYDANEKIGKIWISYKEDPERPITAILTLNTAAHTVGALGVGYEVEKLNPGEYGVAIASAVLTVAILLLSEILPKTIGNLYWRRLTVFTGRTLSILIIILYPIVLLIELLRSLLPEVHTEPVTRIELSALADIAEESEQIEKDEEAVIQNVLRLKEIPVGDVMTPRVVMTTVNINDTVQDVIERIPIMIYGRMPVINESIDDVKGMVLRSDILRRAAVDDYSSTMQEISRDVFRCKQEDSVDKVLDELLQNKVQMLIVKDDFGGTVGLITMEDVIETLLGEEIVDESDQEGIDDGVHHEDMRELAKQRYEDSESE